MKITIVGDPEDIIKRCESCEHCIFEEILNEEQRKIKTLNEKIPKKHVNRHVIEQLCGRYYVDICPMKSAAMRASVDDRTAMQMAVIKNYIWDMGRRYKQQISFSTAIKKWTIPQNLGREYEESRAKRYDDVWNLGVRNVVVDNEKIEKQLLTADLIYEIIMTGAADYEKWLKMLESLETEHKERHDAA